MVDQLTERFRFVDNRMAFLETDGAQSGASSRKLHESQMSANAVTPHPAGAISMLSLCETASGGVGRYQDNLIALAVHGITCRVVLPAADRHILGPDAEAITFDRRRRGLRAMVALLRAFLSERARRKPDVYFFNSTFTLLPLLVLRLLQDRTPAVYCAHCWAVATLNPASGKGRLVRAIEGNLCGLAYLVVNVAEHDAATARRFGYRGQHVTVTHAVAPADPAAREDLFDRTEDNDIHLLFVGRFDRQKGLDLLLPAFSRARKRNPRLHLHLVGGAVRDGAALAEGDGVTNHGWARPDQIDGFCRSADAVIVPSRWEAGMPLVVLEALRNGRPVFASAGCGMGDFLERNGCGAGFALEEDRLVHLLSGLRRADIAAMQANALLAFKENFTLDRFTAEMAHHIRTLTGPRDNA